MATLRHPRTPSFSKARARPDFNDLLDAIEWSLANMPVPRLQRPFAPFIYEIDWDEHTPQAAYFHEASRSVRFLGGAGDHLVRLSSLLRPLLQRLWADRIASLNRNMLKQDYLDRFLFRPSRVPTGKLLEDLTALQGGRCFYCCIQLERRHIDHFLAWSHTADETLDNFVVACRSCNQAKAAHRAAVGHLERWVPRLAATSNHHAALEQLSKQHVWERDVAGARGNARALYLAAPDATKLWLNREKFTLLGADRPKIEQLLKA